MGSAGKPGIGRGLWGPKISSIENAVQEKGQGLPQQPRRPGGRPGKALLLPGGAKAQACWRGASWSQLED